MANFPKPAGRSSWNATGRSGTFRSPGATAGSLGSGPGALPEASPSGGRRIADLEDLIGSLPTEERAVFDRLFEVVSTTGRLVVPDEMRPWVEGRFGSVGAVEEQRVVRATDRVTLEGALFNELRASRPFEAREATDLRAEIEATRGDPFCTPETGTPEDVFGRVRGRRSVTASNVAKYDGFHGVVIFDEHDPLAITSESVDDLVETALRWLRAARESDGEAVYPFLMWNCLWRAGGSVIHGHAQTTATKGSHYPKVERLRRAALFYRAEHGTSYFEDLYRAHEALGLAFDGGGTGARGFASLTPVKEKEVVLLAPDADVPLRRLLAQVLAGYRDSLGVSSFNVAFYLPPEVPAGEDWSGFPVVVHVVDRGDPSNRTSDIGAMELYAASVVSSDPFRVAEALRGAS